MRIPTVKEYDRLTELTGGDNAKMHWKDIFSWTDDTEDEFCLPTWARAARGCYSARRWNYYGVAHRGVAVGFRPALDILGTDDLAADLEEGTAIVIGTLYMDGQPIRVPQNPTSSGDIARYKPGAALELGAPMANAAYQVTGIRVGNALIADRVLLCSISFDDICKIDSPHTTSTEAEGVAQSVSGSSKVNKVKYHNDQIEPLRYIGGGRSDWVDLRAAETVSLKAGEFHMIPLGVSMQLPKGYEAHIVPRSSTFKNFGLILVNSMGIIDESYCGDNDQWHFPALAVRDTTIHVNDRICQFRIVEHQPTLEFVTVDALNGADRGGFGSTGIA